MPLGSLILNEMNCLNNVKTYYIEDLSSHSFSINSINIFSMNIRSIKANFDELVLMLSTMNNSFDIIILSETWLTIDFNFVLNGYCTINSLGELNKCDGVTIFIKDNIS